MSSRSTSPADSMAATRSSSCPIRRCPTYGVALLTRTGEQLTGTYLRARLPDPVPPVTSIIFGVPRHSDLSQYVDFTHLFAPAPTDYLTPGRSWVLLRHRGEVRYARRVLWTMYNERRRRTDDRAYRSLSGSAYLPSGHVIRLAPAQRLRRAFAWLDPRHEGILSPGSIHDPQGGEPFHWQLAMVIPTTDGRRRARSPFTVIRASDLVVPGKSSRVERELSDSLQRAGVALCSHLDALRVPQGVVQPDIAIPSSRTVVEYDGSYWHRGPRNRDRDIRKTQKLLNAGWRVVRVREPGLEPLDFRARGLKQVLMKPNQTGDALADRVLAALD